MTPFKRKIIRLSRFILVLISLLNSSCHDLKISRKQKGNTKITNSVSKVSEPPSTFKFDAFYKKYLDADGIPIISSSLVQDTALYTARFIVLKMVSKIPGIIPELNKFKVRVSIIAANEQATDIPEHRDLNSAFPGTDWNARGRGYGAIQIRPATSCAEENLLCYPIDRYKGENILIHEFAHTIHQMGLRFIEKDFDKKLEQIFLNAKQKGLWKNTYAISNLGEYWAEGVQCWFNANKEVKREDGIHNEINTRLELQAYDLDLYNLISQYFNPEDKICCACN